MTLALNEPGATGEGPTGALKDALTILDAIFTWAFICEFALKLVAFGLLLHPGSYMRNNWNLLDGFIVITSFIELASSGDGGNMGSLRALRALRALRPLRLISRLEGLQIVINTMLRAFKPCSSVAAVALVFYTVFAIIGINLFGGRFYSCTDPSRTCLATAPGMSSELCPDSLNCAGNWTNPESGSQEMRQWLNPTYEETGTTFSFDNFFSSMMVLFEVASLEMWPSVMYATNDVTGVGTAPKRNNKEGNSLFFVIFISVMCFFVMELFVTVIIDNFNEIKAERDGSAFMTEKQIEWVRTQKQLASRRPKEFIAPPPAHQTRRLALFNIVMDERFEMIIFGFIIANVFFMMTEHDGEPEGWTVFLAVMNYIFAFVFTVEMALKWFAMGRTAYFSNGWNRFDSAIVSLTLLSMLLDWCSVELPFDPTLLRVGRIARVFRIVKSSESLKAITQTIFLSLPSMANVGMVLMLMFFIFAIAGMGIFGGMEKGDFITVWCNFDTFVMSIVTLFRCATGESWNGLMHDTMEHSKLSAFYFVLFTLVASYVLLNLFVAIILDQMSDQMEAVKEQASQLKQFSDAWKATKLASVGGDVMQLALNSSSLLAQEDGGSKQSDSERDDGRSGTGGGDKQNWRRNSLGFLADKVGITRREASRRKRWAQREKNVHYLPAYYLKKLIKLLPEPLGMAEVIEPKEIIEPTGMRRMDGKQTVREATNVPNWKLMEVIRECDIPITDGAWVEYKEVLHAMFFRATKKANAKEDEEEDEGEEGGSTQWFHLAQFQRNVPLEHDGKQYASEIDAAADDKKNESTSNINVVVEVDNRFTADEWFAAVVMQAVFRGRKGRVRAKVLKERKKISLSQVGLELVDGRGGKKSKRKKKKDKDKVKRQGGSGGRKYNLSNAV